MRAKNAFCLARRGIPDYSACNGDRIALAGASRAAPRHLQPSQKGVRSVRYLLLAIIIVTSSMFTFVHAQNEVARGAAAETAVAEPGPSIPAQDR